MAGFLKKAWGAPSNAGTGNGPQQGGTGKDAVPPVEWHSEAPGERYFGFENFGNTCYANSVLQSLYFSKPFRHLVESYTPTGLSPSPASASQTTLASNTPVPPPNVPLPPSSASSSALSAAGQAAKAFGSALSTPYAPIAAPTTKRSPTLRGGMGSGGGRGAIFSPHRRQNSVSSAGTDPSSSAGFNGGAPLSHQTTQSSFTGVGAPVTNQNGVLVRESPVAESTLLTTLRDLFSAISAQPKTLGTVAPQAFINQLKRDNEFFRSTLHQDAHEFLNYLINEVAELLEKEEKKRAEEEGRAASIVGTGFGAHAKTWVHSLFEGILTNETRCLTCETVTSRDEAFLDLSIDIEQHTSVTACLRQFSASEMLCQRNKFSCDKCCGLQEAEKRMKIKKLPNILALHLKRFKYEESLQRHVKLTYRVVFPFELRLFNTADDVGNPDRLYELWAIVVHIGVGPHHGHYITIVKSGQRWIVFDDNNVYPIEQSEIARYFGDTPGHGSGYVLFYQAVDLDLDGLDFPVPPTPSMSAAGRERTQTASSSSTNGLASSWTEDPVPPVPPLPAASVSVPVNSSTPPSAAEPPPSAPASPVVVPSALVNPMNGEDGLPSPASSAHSALPRSPSALTQLNPYAPPPPQERKVSATSLSSSISAGEKESGWSSIRGRFGRTKSQVSKDGGRRLSLGGLGSSSCLEPLSSIPAGNSQADVSALDMADQTPRPPAPAFSNATSATTTPDLAGSGELPPPVPINGSHPPAPPSEDGSVSTTSTPLHPTFPHSPSPTHSFPQRRGSRSSYTALDNPPAPSSVSSLSSSGHLPPRQPHSSAPPPASSSSSSSGAAAAPKPSSGVRGFLSRARTEKGRPATANPTTGLSSAPPAPSSGTGLGLGLVTPSGGAGGDAPAPNGGLKSRLSSSASLSGMSVLSKRPSTAAPVVSTSTSPSPLLPSSTSASTNGHPPPPAPSAPTPEPLSKKELERRDKEAKKAREQEVKERAKRDKEAAKVAKEEEKRREKEAKLLRKQSVR